MAPSRSRRKCDKDNETIDILNNIGNRSLRSRVPESSHLVPRGDIFDIPESPEKRQDSRRRVAKSEPITPRRSTRTRGDLDQGNPSSGKRRSTRVFNHNEGGWQGNDEQNGDDNEEDGNYGGLRLFSEDDTPKTRRSSRQAPQNQWDEEELPDFPSPSGLFRGETIWPPSHSPDGQESNASQVEDEGGSDAERSNDEESSKTRDENRFSKERTSLPRSPSPIVQINGTPQANTPLSRTSAKRSGLRSSYATRETPRNNTESQPDHAGDQGQEPLVDNDNAIEKEPVSSFEPDDESDSSSFSFAQEPARFSPDADNLVKPEPKKRRRVGQDSRSRQSRDPRLTPLSGRDGDVRGQSIHSDSEQKGQDEKTAKEEEKARKLQWMEEAMNLGQQRENWLVLTSTAKELKHLADPSFAKYFVGICTVIHELRELYGDMVDHPPSEAALAQCDNLFESIPSEGETLLDQAYHLATRDNREDRARGLVDEFQARVIPDMVKLVFACFRVYYHDPTIFPGVHNHFGRVLILLRRFWDRTSSMKMQRIVRGPIRGKGLGRVLQKLIDALDLRALRPRGPIRRAVANTQGEAAVFENDIGREWSHDEWLALIDGLRAYQGPDRYLRIIGHFGHHLGNRTQQELRAKALQVHDKMQPKIATQVRTVDGRRRWEWLLSVRS